MKTTPLLTLIALVALAPFSLIADVAEIPAEAARSAETPKTSTPAGWTDDFDAAKKQAAIEGKDLLVAFSGSDWCGWCVRLEKEVFSQKSFGDKIRHRAIPVYIDLPQDKNRITPAARKRNPELVEQYGIEYFPTVILIDSDGDFIARTGYVEGGPEKYVEHLKKNYSEGKNSSQYKTQKKLRKIGNGPTRIQKLNEILGTLPLSRKIANIDYVQEILDSDPDGSKGLRKHYFYFTDVLPLEREVHAEAARLEKLAEEALARNGKPQSEAAYIKIISEVVRNNSQKLVALREKVQELKTRLPADNLEIEKRTELLLRSLNSVLRFDNRTDGK